MKNKNTGCGNIKRCSLSDFMFIEFICTYVEFFWHEKFTNEISPSYSNARYHCIWNLSKKKILEKSLP